ncbi:MAG: endonuclease III [Clostridia bacterium]
MKKLQTKKEINEIIQILKNCYTDAKCGLNYTTPLELTVALILAAQCTDNMVNKITPILFTKYPTLESLASANITDIQKIVKPCGFYITKAKNISLTANSILKNYNGKVPNTMEELTKLYGIRRKSSNIILQECYNTVVGIAVDTHVSRTCYRMGFTKKNIPIKQEQELIKKVDKKYFNKLNHILVYHGRAICSSRSPKCEICPIKEKCKRVGL